VSFLFGGGSGGQTQQQKDLTTAQTDIAKFGLGEAKKNLPAAATALKGPQDFFTALMSGDRKSILNALAPEVDTLTSQYDTGRKTAEEFAPRGGGRAAALEELPFRKAGEINKMVQGARDKGAAGLTSISQLFGQLGTSELSGGTSAANSAFGNIQDAKINQQQQQAQAGQAVGALIALLVGM
jgi:hypothetical protein